MIPENVTPALAVFYAIRAAANPISFAMFPVCVFYRTTTRGTRLRYILASLLPVVIIANFVVCLVSIVTYAAEQKWFYVVLYALLTAASIYIYRMYVDDSDDTFWKKMGRKVKNAIRNVRVARVTPVRNT